MADTPDEEPIHKPVQSETETLPDESHHVIHPDTITPLNPSDDMEVHHHAHHEGKRGWNSYIREFLMLFLAVFCGFLAEYQLEHIIEHQREKIYIRSMVEDLKKDTANFNTVINNFLENEAHLEIVLRGFEEGRNKFSESWTREFVSTARMGFTDFFYTDRTLQQLKNS